MVNWQVTATTIYCDAVDDEVTLMVFKDGSVKCISQERYGRPDRDTARMMERKRERLGHKLECEGPQCQRGIQYRDKLFAEEGEVAGSAEEKSDQ